MKSLILSFLVAASLAQAKPLSILIIDGRNNHDWVQTTDAIRASLLQTKQFEVTVSTAPESKIPAGPRRPRTEDQLAAYEAAAKLHREMTADTKKRDQEAWMTWNPDFENYHAVLLNYNGPDFPPAMKETLVAYVRNGGGLVLVHAANNGFGNWDDFNDMIGLGWRKGTFGTNIKIDPDSGKPFADCEDCNSGHGSRHAFPVTVRQPDHPIMKDLPAVWMHGKDELYHHMRGPAKNLTVLSSAFSDPKQRGTGKHEPITWEVAYGKGRVIVTTMGHFWRGQTDWDGLYCVGFQTVIARSLEYAATGTVSLPVPKDFPGPDEISIRAPSEGAPRRTGLSESAKAKKEQNAYGMLTPAEEGSTFEIAAGYEVELAVAEPHVVEPVLTVWDGNGAMYVAEMRSYMQDEKGTGTKTMKNGRIKRLEDTNGDGRYDRVTIFADNLNLPRAVLPLDDRIAVRETDSFSVWSFRDTDGDGVADEKKILYEGKAIDPGRSVEHQDSGLVWNLDNHIYITYNSERYRFTDGTWKREGQPGHWTQWGLTHDDTGRLFWIDNTKPLRSEQLHPKYWTIVRRLSQKRFNSDPITLGNPFEMEFLKANSSCLLNDRGGSASAVRAFTSTCGQSILRSNRFPIDAYGDYFFCDPTIHVVRRAHVTQPRGKVMLEKAEPGTEEFLRSSDINSRFVNTAVGPDGCLYVTDMYRGIIQDAPWLSPGPREFIRKSGLSKNIQHGRIWRIRHADHQPGPRPHMLEETTVELLRHLRHPIGWWRDTAQKLIILRDDRESVAPLLKNMIRFNDNALERLHALWTLEGMNQIDREILRTAYQDRDSRIRAAAVHISESDPNFEDLARLAADRDPRVAEQLILTMGTTDDPRADPIIQQAARKHLADKGVMMATLISVWGKSDLPLIKDVKTGAAFQSNQSEAAADWIGALSSWERGMEFPKDMPEEQKRMIRSGEAQYYGTCVTCHGPEGKGLQIPGTDLFLAPPLVGSKRVLGAPEHLVPILVNGLVGPIDGKTYQAGFMAPASALGINRDDRLAEVLSFIRYAWGQNAPPIDRETVKKLRQQHESRTTPWTQEELEKIGL